MSEEKQPKIRFKGFDDPWEQRKLGEIFEERKENPKGQTLKMLSVTINSGIVDANVLNRKDNSNSNKSNYKVVHANDIAYNSMRMWQGASGVSNELGIVSPAYTFLKPRVGLDVRFWGYLFKLTKMLQEFQKNSQGLTSDTWNLKYKQIKSIEVTMPSKNEQNAISQLLQKLDFSIAANQSKLEQLKRLKKLLMQKIFNQEWRFKGFTDPWEQRKLGEGLKQLKSYSLPRKYEVPESDTEYIHYGDIHTSSRKYVDKSFRLPNIKSGDFQLLQTGDIVLADASEDYKEIAEPMLMKNIKGRKVVSGLHTIAIRLKCGDPVYYLYLFCLRALDITFIKLELV
ncbi:restriction endonuclease subunit S [Lentilactobacillus hilgardii]|uniref:restriction endonuclease subunit S n=1 Tax=Lentilactobacillus hilgardii TaxID=1588 RepID=UPI00390C8BCD